MNLIQTLDRILPTQPDGTIDLPKEGYIPMNKFRSLVFVLSALVGCALIQFAAPPAFATADATVRNTNGFFAKIAADGKYYPAQLCYSTDGSQALIPCRDGGVGVTPLKVPTATSNVTSAAYTTFPVATSAPSTWVNVYNGSSQEIVIATGTTGTWVDKLYVPATSFSGPVHLFVPSGTWFGVESKGSTISSGSILINLVQ